MTANQSKINNTLTTAGQSPPESLLAKMIHDSPGMVEMVSLSRKQLMIELELIGDNLKAAAMYIQLSSTFRAETRIARAQERLDKLLAAVKGEDEEYLYLLREQKMNASRGLY